MKKVENKALIARLNEMRALKLAGREMEGIEMRKGLGWFLNEENRTFCLRVVDNGEPTTFVDVIPIR